MTPMSANIPRSLPYSSWDEWTTVKNDLYSVDPAEVVRSLEIVSMWRVRGRLPLSIDCTANLVELRLRDSPAASYSHSENELKLLYSSVVVRAVNGLVDPSQQGIYATSVLTLAERIGLPGWIVELRHDATHNQIPSLSVLRTAATTLLGWYHDNYWASQWNLLQSLSASSMPRVHPVAPTTPSTGSQHTSQPSSAPASSSESSLPQDCSPTFVCEIFVPLYVGAILHASTSVPPPPTSGKKGSKLTTEDRYLQQHQLWAPRLTELFKANPRAVHGVVAGLLSAVCDAIAQLSKNENAVEGGVVEAHLGALHYTLKQLLAEEAVPAAAAAAAVGATTGSLSGFVDRKMVHPATVQFVHALLERIQDGVVPGSAVAIVEVVSRVVKLVRGRYSTGNVPAAGDYVSASTIKEIGSGASVLGKRKAAAERAGVCGRGGRKSEISRVLDYPVWPLGCVAGVLGCGDLYLIEEVI